VPETKATAKQLSQGIKLRLGVPHVVKVIPPPVPRVRLIGMHFDLNKAFLLPSAIPGIKAIKQAYADHPNAKLLVVGHTDTSGKDEYNLTLSLERADSVAAYLKDDVASWDKFFSHSNEGKRWGTKEIQAMLSKLPDGGDPFYAGQPSGFVDGKTAPALKNFQASQGLPQSGNADATTRQSLIKAYMGLDGASLPSGISITAHGCGESFPAASVKDGVRSPDDRRVEAFLFDGPIVPAPAPDRLSRKGAADYPQWLAAVTDTFDFAFGAPDALAPFTMQLLNARRQPLRGIEYTLKVGNHEFKDKTDDNGFLTKDVDAAAIEGKITVGASTMNLVFKDLAPASTPLGAQQRLSNLGLMDIDRANGQDDQEFSQMLASFQESDGLPVSGTLDAGTQDGLGTAVA
jgi:outer membrane protein OmpA-like peptidoglycan-associated protein